MKIENLRKTTMKIENLRNCIAAYQQMLMTRDVSEIAPIIQALMQAQAELDNVAGKANA